MGQPDRGTQESDRCRLRGFGAGHLASTRRVAAGGAVVPPKTVEGGRQALNWEQSIA
ncbi:MAG: hypothetical protein AAF773_20615 [Cyanobacteria bacterium P01_D01_bin.115]